MLNNKMIQSDLFTVVLKVTLAIFALRMMCFHDFYNFRLVLAGVDYLVDFFGVAAWVGVYPGYIRIRRLIIG